MSEKTKNIAIGIVIGAIFSLSLFGFSGTGENNGAFASAQASVSSGWTISSYEDANEAVYTAGKIEVFDSARRSLGFYRSDFLEQVKIDGSGKGDGVLNSGKYLHYDYNVDDGKTYYLTDKSIGSYGTVLVPWTGDKPSIAINPPLPRGSRVHFLDLGPDARYNAQWVNDLLKNKTFYADDQFSGESGKRIDIYVGLQKVRDPVGTDESLWMGGVTVSTEPPCVPTGISETICNGVDDNCDGRIDEGCVPNPPAPNNTQPNTTIPNNTQPNTTIPNNTVPNGTNTSKSTYLCQYASSASATSQNSGSEAINAVGAPNVPSGGECSRWSGPGYDWNPRNWNVKANITLKYNASVNVSNFTIYGDYDMCWSKMWLKNSATNEVKQVFAGFDKNCTSTHNPDRTWAGFDADTIILQTCGWSWSSTDAVQMCGGANG